MYYCDRRIADVVFSGHLRYNTGKHLELCEKMRRRACKAAECFERIRTDEKGRSMQRILIFAGTTEGRELAEFLQNYDVQVLVSTATEYGKACINERENIEVMSGRLNQEEMEDLIRDKRIDLVLDATHPFAVLVTEHIRAACRKEKVRYIRCRREAEDIREMLEKKKVVQVDSVAEAADYLKRTEGNILIATGSKELRVYTEIPDYRERCYVRVLSTKAAVEESISLGFEGKHLIAMQGPFSKEMNQATLQQVGAKYFVTKESGKAGGFAEKAEAAEKAEVTLVVVGRPKENEGMLMREVMDYLGKWLTVSEKSD